MAAAFRDLGAAFIDLDVVGHDILLRDDLKADLVAAFGPEIIGADGEVVRPELAKRAFVSPEKTALLNATTHPRLIEEAKRRLAAFEEDGALATIIEISPYDGPDGSFGVFTDMADAVVAELEPFQQRYQQILEDGSYLKVLRDGAKKASAIAEKTLKRVQKAVGLLPIDE